MRIFETVGKNVQPVGLGATLICFGGVALGVVGSAITSPTRAYVLTVALALTCIGFPMRRMRMTMPRIFVHDDRGPTFITMKWASLLSAGFSFLVGCLGATQLKEHGISTPPVLLSAAGAIICVATTLVVAHRTDGMQHLVTS